MVLEALVFVSALIMMVLFTSAVYQHREKRRALQKRFIHRLAVAHSSRYWEGLEAEYVKLRIGQFGLNWWEALKAAHQSMVKHFVAGVYHDDEVVRATAESFGIGVDALTGLLGDALFNYCRVIVAHDPYHQRVLGVDSIYVGMTVCLHNQYLQDAVAVEVVREPFLYDGSSSGSRFWTIEVRDVFDPEDFQYLALADYSVLPHFEEGTTFNGKSWLEYIPPETEEIEAQERGRSHAAV